MRTPLVSGLAAASLGLLVLGLALRSWQVVLLALPPLLFLALGALSVPSRPRVKATRTLSRDRIQVGTDVYVDLTVHNAGRSLDLVEILDVLPSEFDLVRGTNHAVVPLPAGEAVTLSYAMRPVVKGEYVVGPLRVRSFDSLGLGIEDAVVHLESSVAVAPTLEDLRRASLVPRRTRPWFGQVPSRRLGIGTSFWGIRDYEPGDEVRRINWKATARLDRPLTNEYEGDRSGDVVIVLDARRESFVGTPSHNPVEHGVRAALGIAEHVLASRNRVGLVVQRNVLDRVMPAFGKKQLYRILDALIHVRTGGDWPFSHVAWVLSRYFPRDAHVVLISPLADRTALDAVMGIAARGHEVAIISPSPLAIERDLARPGEEQEVAYRILRMDRENLLAQLRRVADVVDWDPSTPLALSLPRWRPRTRVA